MRIKLLLRLMILALPLLATACEDNDLFGDKKTPLTGDRRPLFPGGVPGVDYDAPPAQPSNSNIPISTTVKDPAEHRQGDAASGESGQGAAATPRSRANTQGGDPDDPWSGARTARPD